MLRRVLVGLLAAAAVLGLALAARITWVGYGPPAGSSLAEAQTRHLHRRIAAGAAAEQQLFPEGDYFLRALTALAEARTGTPDLDAVRALRNSLDRSESVAVFGSGMVPEHGIFAAGWALPHPVDAASWPGPAPVRSARRCRPSTRPVGTAVVAGARSAVPGSCRGARAGPRSPEADRLTCQTGSVRDVVILGSTGSIGTQALQVVADQPGRFRVVALAAGGSNVPLLARQALDTGAELVALSRSTAVQDLQLALYAEASRRGWSSGEVRLPRIVSGPDAAREAATVPCDVVLNGITGAAGLAATLATLATGRILALANKESLVIGGPLVTRAAAPGQLVAVDSEHSALAQCLRGGAGNEVDRLVLTASGGPFRGRSREQMQEVTPAEALAHPTWAMGRVITTNSATLVNKGLELLEAHLLYGVALDRIDVVVHPQSIVHSMVQFVDGSTLAQCSPPDMRLPIALGLSWPERLPAVAPACDWSTSASWTFEPLDNDAFPAVELARHAGRLGGSAPAVYNAANEECVEAFHARQIRFLDIVDIVERVLAEHAGSAPEGGTGADVGSRLVAGDELTLDGVLAADAWARVRARELVSEQERVH